MADERTLGQLVAQASQDLSELVRYEVALAKSEIVADVKRGAIGGASFAVAGFMGLISLITLVITFAYVLVAIGLAPWLSFLIVTVALWLLAGVVIFIGIRFLKKIKPPERTIASTKLTIAAIQGKRSN
jgi:Putative Actinobacterial Holin-X, holin superfamily III